MVYPPSLCTGTSSRTHDADPLDWDGAAIAIGDRVRKRGEHRSRYVIGINNDDPSWVVVDWSKRSTQGQQVRASDLIHVL